MILTWKQVSNLNSAVHCTQQNLQRMWLGFIHINLFGGSNSSVKDLPLTTAQCHQALCNTGALSVQLTGLGLHWQLVSNTWHTDKRYTFPQGYHCSAFHKTEQNLKFPLGEHLGFLVSDQEATFLSVELGGFSHQPGGQEFCCASRRAIGEQREVCTAWGAADSWGLEEFCGIAHVLTWFWVIFFTL